MSEATDFAAARRLPASEAIAYMAGRGLVGQTYSAYDLWRDEHGRAFTISRLARADLMEALQEGVEKSVAGDLSRRDWITNAETLLRGAGWWGTNLVTDPRTGEVLKTRFNHNRLQLIFDTNLRQAQAAGQWQRMLRNQRTHPYARYVSMDDDRVRPLHRAWHNTVLPLDDAWWSTHRPPNGYRCRCRVIGVTQREYDAGVVRERPGAATAANAAVRRVRMSKTAPVVNMVDWTNPATGQTMQIPAGIDPGFDYNAGTVGRSSVAFDAMVQAKLSRLPAAIARAAQAGRIRAAVAVDEMSGGQRAGLLALPDMVVAEVQSEALGAIDAPASVLVNMALRRMPQLRDAPNADTGWLLSAAGDDTQDAGPLDDVMRTIAREAVLVESRGGVHRLVAAVRVSGQAYRVWLQVQAGPAGQPHQVLSAAMQSGAPVRTQPDGRVAMSELLRGATRQDGSPFTS